MTPRFSAFTVYLMGLGSWFVPLGIQMVLFSWLAAIVGVFAKSVEAVQWLSFVLIFPLTFASSAFVPADSFPRYLKTFAINQPITQVVEAVRALILGTPLGNHGWLAVVWSLGILLVCMPLAAWLFKRKTSL